MVLPHNGELGSHRKSKYNLNVRMWSDGEETLLNDKVWSESVSVQPLWNGAKGRFGSGNKTYGMVS